MEEQSEERSDEGQVPPDVPGILRDIEHVNSKMQAHAAAYAHIRQVMDEGAVPCSGPKLEQSVYLYGSGAEACIQVDLADLPAAKRDSTLDGLAHLHGTAMETSALQLESLATKLREAIGGGRS